VSRGKKTDKANIRGDSTHPTRVDTLKVPGASIYYEVRRAGPVLLMIWDGPTDADFFAGIAGLLAGRYTVVTYDPRGNSRSSLEGLPEDYRTEVHGDDAFRLLDATGTEPAYVFGNSGGTLVALELAARHPDTVRTLVTHEPPAVELLPDAAQHRAFSQEVYDTYRRDGLRPAMQKFLAYAGLDSGSPPGAAGPQGEPTHEILEMRLGWRGTSSSSSHPALGRSTATSPI
jgi:pimeloyl-ACP methyl ester carboxylesterase